MVSKILYIEDNYNNARLVTKLLYKYPCTMHIAENALAALDILADNDVDIILMDINLPVVDGVTLLKYIKEDERYRNIPSVAITANAMHGDRENYLESGFDAYIAKPIARIELYNVLDRLISKKKDADKLKEDDDECEGGN